MLIRVKGYMQEMPAKHYMEQLDLLNTIVLHGMHLVWKGHCTPIMDFGKIWLGIDLKIHFCY